jgi:hypothetical protein
VSNNNSHGARKRCQPVNAPKTRKLRLAIDFDGTLHTGSYTNIGEPMPWAREVLEDAHDNGDYIIIHTCRARPDETVNGKFWATSSHLVAGWLRDHSIPFDEITALKPYADVYIDDRAIEFVDWNVHGTDLYNLRRAQ